MGSAALINTRMTEQGFDDLAPLSHYTVKKGETLAVDREEAACEPLRSGRGQLPLDEVDVCRPVSG